MQAGQTAWAESASTVASSTGATFGRGFPGCDRIVQAVHGSQDQAFNTEVTKDHEAARRGKDVQFDEGFRADILLERQIVVEIEAPTKWVPAHDAGVLTWLRMDGFRQFVI